MLAATRLSARSLSRRVRAPSASVRHMTQAKEVQSSRWPAMSAYVAAVRAQENVGNILGGSDPDLPQDQGAFISSTAEGTRGVM